MSYSSKNIDQLTASSLQQTWCPEKVLTGLFSPTLQTYVIIVMWSVEHVTNESLFHQSTSRVGAEN